MTRQLTQAQLLDIAVKRDTVYCLTKYITNCGWDEGIALSESMCRIATFFAYIECLQKHEVQIFSNPFEKWQYGPVVVEQYAYTKLWPWGVRIKRSEDEIGKTDPLIVFTDIPHPIKGLRSFQELAYDHVEWYFDNKYPYLRPILNRIFGVLDKMDNIALSHLLLQLAMRLFAKQGEQYCLMRYNNDNAVLVSMQELRTFPLFEVFLAEITT